MAAPAEIEARAQGVARSGEVFLEDLGSRHGCLVNGERIRTVAHIGDHDDVRLVLD